MKKQGKENGRHGKESGLRNKKHAIVYRISSNIPVVSLRGAHQLLRISIGYSATNQPLNNFAEQKARFAGKHPALAYLI